MALLPIIDYVSLIAAVTSWLERTDVSDPIPVAIALAEKRMNRTLRVRQMIRRSQSPFLVGVEYVDLPDDYIELVRARPITVPPSNPLRILTPQQLDQELAYNDTSKPLFGYAALEGLSLRVATAPTATGTLEIVYYGTIPPITATSPTNWMIQQWPDAYLYGTLTEMAPYLRDDDRLPLWKGSFEEKINEIQAADERQSMSGGPMRTRGGPLV
jgi:hypothetical protein